MQNVPKVVSKYLVGAHSNPLLHFICDSPPGPGGLPTNTWDLGFFGQKAPVVRAAVNLRNLNFKTLYLIFGTTEIGCCVRPNNLKCSVVSQISRLFEGNVNSVLVSEECAC